LAANEGRGAFAFIQCLQVLGHTSFAAALAIMRSFAYLIEPGGLAVISVPYTPLPEDCFYAIGRAGDSPEPFEDLAGDRVSVASAHGRQSTLVRLGRNEYDRLAAAPRPGILHVRHFSQAAIMTLIEWSGFFVLDHAVSAWYTEERGDLMMLTRRRG
jgi:hypothetical protein